MSILKRLAKVAERDIERGDFRAAWDQIEAMAAHDYDYADRAADRWAARYDAHATQPALFDAPTPPGAWE